MSEERKTETAVFEPGTSSIAIKCCNLFTMAPLAIGLNHIQPERLREISEEYTRLLKFSQQCFCVYLLNYFKLTSKKSKLLLQMGPKIPVAGL